LRLDQGLRELRLDQSIVLLKADKGNCVVLLRKADYISELERIVQDTSKFRLLKEDPAIMADSSPTRRKETRRHR